MDLRPRTFLPAWATLLLAGCLTVAPPGFIRNGRHTTYRGWMDVNTLGQPAAFIEEADRLPPSRERVRHYRWMYGFGAAEPTAKFGTRPNHSIDRTPVNTSDLPPPAASGAKAGPSRTDGVIELSPPPPPAPPESPDDSTEPSA